VPVIESRAVRWSENEVNAWIADRLSERKGETVTD